MKEFLTNLLGNKKDVYIVGNIPEKNKRAIITEKQLDNIYNIADLNNQIPKAKIKIGKYLLESIIKKVVE